MDEDVRRLVERLRLEPHPEGGFYRETFRSPLALGGLPHGAPRSASTAIYFLLPAGEFSAFHRVRSDEAWHHYEGGPVTLHVIAPGGGYTTHRLAGLLAGGDGPQAVIPADAWQAAEGPASGYALCGCTVAPGFDFADFELARRSELAARFPDHADIIGRFTRG